MSGAGTGTGVILALRRAILRARPRGLTAWYAAGTGSVRPRASVPRTGTATTRPAGTPTSASVSFAPSSLGSGEWGLLFEVAACCQHVQIANKYPPKKGSGTGDWGLLFDIWGGGGGSEGSGGKGMEKE
jgi:hypothetical protein